MRKDNSIYNKKQPGLYIYLYLQSQIPTSCSVSYTHLTLPTSDLV